MKLHMGVYLRVKFQVSIIILTSFRQEVGEGGVGNFTTNLSLPPQNKLLKSSPRLGLKLKDIIYQKRKQKIITDHQWKKTFMTNPLIMI